MSYYYGQPLVHCYLGLQLFLLVAREVIEIVKVVRQPPTQPGRGSTCSALT